MRISDWSSDVCSSDLIHRRRARRKSPGLSPPAYLPRHTTQVPGRRTAKQPNAQPSVSHWYEARRSEEHTSELQSLMRISYAVFCLKKKTKHKIHTNTNTKDY